MPSDLTGLSSPAPLAPARETLTILVVYEDVLTGLLARRMLDYISDVLRPGHELQVTLQKADHLRAAPTAGPPAENPLPLTLPDVLLISIYGREPPPTVFERCMESRVGDHTARRGGLAALLVNLASANGCRAALEQIAQERGWDFFTWRK